MIPPTMAPVDRPRELAQALARAGAAFHLQAAEILLPPAGGRSVGPFRETDQVGARRMIARELHRIGWSYPRIARALGYNEHTAVINLVRHEGRA